MEQSKLGRTGIHLCVSNSVANFTEKILKNLQLPEWKWWQVKKPVLFIGMYNWTDYLKFLWHRGEKTIFWCGSDIKNLNWFWARFFRKARNICENEIEQSHLAKFGIRAGIKPMFFGNVNDFPISFKPSKNPQVFLCAHSKREEEYGVYIIEKIAPRFPEITFHIYGIKGENKNNIVYHGLVSEEQFNREIKDYQVGLRLNEFDGFSEVLAKSALLGQYPISRIYYPFIDYAKKPKDLFKYLNMLKYKKRPNYKASEFWRKKLCEHLLLAKEK